MLVLGQHREQVEFALGQVDVDADPGPPAEDVHLSGPTVMVEDDVAVEPRRRRGSRFTPVPPAQTL